LAAGTTIVPTVVATAAQGAATAVVTPAASIPGTTSVLVTSSNANQNATISIAFVINTPGVSAPTPLARDAGDVISIFSDAYTDVAETNFNPNWGQSTVVTTETIAGNATLKYANFNFQGTTFGSVQDASSMTHLHVDVWTLGPDIDIRPISIATGERAYNVTATPRTWMSYDILLSDLTSLGLAVNDLKELKFDGGTGETVFIDNIFFYKGEAPSELPALSPYCNTTTLDNNSTPDSEVLLTITNTSSTTIDVSIESTDGNAVNQLLIQLASNASESEVIVGGKYTKTLTYNSTLATIDMQLLWGKENISGLRQLNLTGLSFEASCSLPDALNVTISTTTTADVSCGNLDIASGVTYTVSSGHTLSVLGDITGTGELVVSSGASLITTNGNNTGSATIKRNTRYADGKYSFVGSPVAASDGIRGSALGSIVYSYDETIAYGTDGLSRWIDASATQLTPGIGYAQANQQEITFTGVPNDGTITVSGLSHTALDDKHGEHGWSLLSNPYPAAIDVTKFLTDATNSAVLNGSIYLWDDHGSEAGRGDNGDYLTANSLGAVGGPNGGVFNGYIGSMQGFFVKIASPTADASVVFTESMRVGGVNTDGSFFRKDNAQNLNVRLALQTESGLYNELLVGLRENATIGVDRSFDADKLIADQDLQFYSMIESNKYAIQGLPLVDGVSTELAFNLGEGSALTLSVKELVASAEQHFYLYDKVTGMTYDLNKTESISFSASKGSDQNRFVLTYSVSDVLANETLTKDPIYRFANNELTINFNGSTLVSEYAIYDLSGKTVLSNSLNSSLRELTIPINSKGINIIRIVTAEGTFTRKFLF